MKAKIAVIGMGQGGMVAAIKLAKAGCEVTVYERKARDEVGYPWRDDIRSDIFEKVGLPPLPADAYVQKPNWVFVAPDWRGSLAVPVLKPLEEISVSRRHLCRYFIDLAEQAGARCVFGTTVQSLWIEGAKVVGVVVDNTPVGYDLVIDASGLSSPFRAQLPAEFGVQATPSATDVLIGHRAFYRVPEGASTFAEGIRCTMSVRPLGWEGISWCNHGPDGECDVLIARMGDLTEAQIAEMRAALAEHHAILGDELLHAETVPICLRKGIARPVADGYVALGDSAFMTIPVMGSGIEASMQGGSIFANHVIANGPVFTAKGMWGFYVEYMRVLGKGFALLDAVRRCALRWPTPLFDWVFGGKFLTYPEVAYIMLAKGYGKPALPLGAFLRTLFMLAFKPSVSFKLWAAVAHGVRAASIASQMPRQYDAQALARWQRRYDGHLATLDRVTAKYGKKKKKA